MDREGQDDVGTGSAAMSGSIPEMPGGRGLVRPPRTALVSPPTEDEELLNRPISARPRERAPELAAFTHTDPWRVLRIQGEFVNGFDALADVGAAVAVFGSARFGPENPYYDAARQL